MTAEPPLSPLWRGYLTGANRGRFWIRLKQRAGSLIGRALFFDNARGPCVIRLEGSRSGRTLDLRILSFESFGPSIADPLDGQIRVELSDDFKAANGTWRTDVGTAGTGSLSTYRALPGWFFSRLLAVRMRFLWRRHLPSLYLLLVGAVAVLAAEGSLALSTPLLILLLLPSPYVFRRHIGQLIQGFKLRRFGPLEIGEQSPVNPLLGQAVRQQVEEAVRLVLLDGFFVPRTKALLAWLASRGTVTRQEFDQMAGVFGVAADNIDVTRGVVAEFGCATVTDEAVAITPWGRRYVAHLAGQ